MCGVSYLFYPRESSVLVKPVLMLQNAARAREQGVPPAKVRGKPRIAVLNARPVSLSARRGQLFDSTRSRWPYCAFPSQSEHT